MYLSQQEKKRHPEYEQYIALFEETITQMESGARGRGAPETIIERCLDKALEFYDADSAALVETNLDLGYGVCVSEHCKTGTRSFEGRIIGVTPEETPCLYEKVMALEVFDVHVQEERGQLSNNEYSMDKLSVKLDTVTKEIAVAEKRRDEVDLYFSIDNKWLRTFVETGAQNEMTSELFHQLIQRIDVYSDKRIQITFNYDNWMNPLLECVEALKRREIQPV